MDTPQPPWETCAACTSHPHSEEVFSGVQTECTQFKFERIALHLALSRDALHHCKTPDSVLFVPSSLIFIHVDKTPNDPSPL